MSANINLKPFCEDVLIEFASRCGLLDPTVDMLDNVDKQFGITSPINVITLCGSKNGKNESMELFIKKASQIERVRRHVFVPEMFQRESYVYDVVLPKFEELYKDYTWKHQPALRFIKYFGSCKEEGEEYVVLEDINSQGYATRGGLAPQVQMNMESVIRWIAHFHGLSFVMKKRDPVEFNELTRNLDDFQTRDLKSLKWKTFETFLMYLREILEAFLLNEGYTVDDLKKYLRPCYNKLQKGFQYYYSPKKYGVICHGDYHKQNILFHADNAPGNIRVVDYQYAKYTSPCLDLSFIVFTTTHQQAIRPMLDLYRHYLAEFLTDFGYNIEEMYPTAVFEQEWRNYVPFTILLAGCGVAQVSSREWGLENRVEVMLGNIPPSVWDKRTIDPDLRAFYLNIIEYIKRKDITASEYL